MTFPIVLAHGVCRFDKIWNDDLDIDNSHNGALDNFHYFKGVKTKLEAAGFKVFHSNVSWAADVETRAGDLLRNIQEILQEAQTEKINIIAHSMGGLDARHMLFKYRDSTRIHEHVASLTTISTPHWGSPFADWGTDNLPYVIPVAKELGLNLEAFRDLRTDCCNEFNCNPDVIAFEGDCGVKFQTYAGKQDFWGVFGPLKLPCYIIEKQEGENDGLVSVKSAMWKESYFVDVLDHADHLNEIGWWDPDQIFERESPSQLLDRIHAFYLEVAQGLP